MVRLDRPEDVVVSDTKIVSSMLLDELPNLMDDPSGNTTEVSGVMAGCARITSIEMLSDEKALCLAS